MPITGRRWVAKKTGSDPLSTRRRTWNKATAVIGSQRPAKETPTAMWRDGARSAKKLFDFSDSTSPEKVGRVVDEKNNKNNRRKIALASRSEATAVDCGGGGDVDGWVAGGVGGRDLFLHLPMPSQAGLYCECVCVCVCVCGTY